MSFRCTFFLSLSPSLPLLNANKCDIWPTRSYILQRLGLGKISFTAHTIHNYRYCIGCRASGRARAPTGISASTMLQNYDCHRIILNRLLFVCTHVNSACCVHVYYKWATHTHIESGREATGELNLRWVWISILRLKSNLYATCIIASANKTKIQPHSETDTHSLAHSFDSISDSFDPKYEMRYAMRGYSLYAVSIIIIIDCSRVDEASQRFHRNFYASNYLTRVRSDT